MKTFRLTTLAFLIVLAKISFAQAPVAGFTGTAGTTTATAPTAISGCEPLVVIFQSTSTNSTSLSWNFGNGQTKSGSSTDPSVISPTVIYSAGTFTVTLVATNSSGSNTQTMVINAFKAPTADFSISDVTVCAGIPINFGDLSTPGSGAITTWTWSFAKGSPSFSTSQNPIPITFDTAGTLQISLTVQDANGCQSKISKNIVANKPVSSFTGSPLTACNPTLTTNFTSTSTGNSLTYLWNFGGGSGPTTAQNPSANFVTNGTFPVTLTVTDNFGCTNTSAATSVFIGKPTPAFTVSNVCDGTPVGISDNSTGGNSWFYTFGDPFSGASNTSNLENPVHTFAGGPGVYSIKQVVTNVNGCKDSITKTITIFLKPNAGFTTDTLKGCALPFNVTFNDTTTGVNAWSWDANYVGFPQTVDGSTKSFTFPYNSEGTFSVSLIVTTANGCKDTIIKSNLIQIQRPVAAISSVSPLRGCFPLAVSASGATSTPGVGGPITNYHWDFGVNPVPAPTDIFDYPTSTPPATYTYQDTGDWVITMVVTNFYGCKDTTTFQYVEVGTHVNFDFDADIKEGCFPMNENKFHYVNLDAPKFYADSIAWFYGAPGAYGPPPTCSNPIISGFVPTGKIPIGASYLDPVYKFQNRSLDTGFIMLKVVVGFNGCNDTLTKPDFLYIHPPAVNFTTSKTNICNYDNHTIIFTNTSKAVFSNTTWLWDFGTNGTIITGTDESSAVDTSFTYPTPGIYTAWLYGISRDSSRLTPYGPWGGPFSGAPYIFGANTTSPLPPPYNTFTNLNILSCKDSNSTVINVSDLSASISTTIEGCSSLIDTLRGNSFDLIGLTGLANSWVWDFGDPKIPLTGNNGATVYHTYTTLVDTTYNAQLIATNTYGCKDTVYQAILVHAIPIANFAVSDTSGCIPFPVNFTDQSTTNIGTTVTAWNWNFGDPSTLGDTSLIQNPSYIYNVAAAPGSTFPVSLIVQNSEGCFSTPFIFNEEPTQPVAGFNFNFNSCNGAPVTFDAGTGVPPLASQGVGLTYTWNYGDGTPIVTLPASTSSHTYNVPADTNFIVTLTVTDKNGCDSTIQKPIFISKPIAAFGQSYTVLGCYPYYASFFDSSSTGSNHFLSTWQYTYGDGTLSPLYTDSTTAAGASNVYNKPGVYTVSLTVTNDIGCSATLTKIDLIHVGGPTATWHYAPTSGFCAPSPVTFYLDSVNGASSYVWLFGDLTSAPGSTTIIAPDSLVHIYTSGGTFTPYLHLEDTAGCKINLPGPIPITVTGAIVSFTADKDTLCASGTVNFTNLTNLAGVTALSWTWNFGPNATPQTFSGQTPPPVSYSGVGSDTVSLVVTSNTPGCGPYTTTFPNMITLLQNAPLTLTGSGSSCPPLMVVFGVDTLGKGISTFQWDFGNGTSSLVNDLNASTTYSISGVYQPILNVTYNNGCPGTYLALPDTAYPTPTADFTYSPITSGFLFDNFQFTNTSLNFIPSSSTWNFGDSTGNFLVLNPAHKFTAEGNYPVMLSVSNSFGCVDTITKIINVDYEIDIPNVFTPNGDGVNDYFTIKLPTDGKCVSIDVYDRWGIKMYSNSDFKNDWKGTDTKGNKLNTDTYYYIVNYCESFTINGWVFVQN